MYMFEKKSDYTCVYFEILTVLFVIGNFFAYCWYIYYDFEGPNLGQVGFRIVYQEHFIRL